MNGKQQETMYTSCFFVAYCIICKVSDLHNPQFPANARFILHKIFRVFNIAVGVDI
jgi:hypothetical protein